MDRELWANIANLCKRRSVPRGENVRLDNRHHGDCT